MFLRGGRCIVKWSKCWNNDTPEVHPSCWLFPSKVKKLLLFHCRVLLFPSEPEATSCAYVCSFTRPPFWIYPHCNNLCTVSKRWTIRTKIDYTVAVKGLRASCCSVGHPPAWIPKQVWVRQAATWGFRHRSFPPICVYGWCPSPFSSNHRQDQARNQNLLASSTESIWHVRTRGKTNHDTLAAQIASGSKYEKGVSLTTAHFLC